MSLNRLGLGLIPGVAKFVSLSVGLAAGDPGLGVVFSTPAVAEMKVEMR